MHRLLKLYRGCLDSTSIPDWIKAKVESFGMRVFQELFQARHTRLELYTIRPTEQLTLRLWLDWQDYTDAGYLFRRVWELANVCLLYRVLKAGDIAVDLGAHIGYFSLLMAHLVQSGFVLSVEPFRRNLHVLRKNLYENNVRNVFVVESAIGGVEERRILRYRFLNSGSPSIVNFFGDDPIENIYMMEEEVVIKTLPRLFGDYEIERCRFIKMDIQGAEYDVCHTMLELLQDRRVDYILMEYNPKAYGGRYVNELLKNVGYLPYRVNHDGTLTRTDELLPKVDYVFTHLR